MKFISSQSYPVKKDINRCDICSREQCQIYGKCPYWPMVQKFKKLIKSDEQLVRYVKYKLWNPDDWITIENGKKYKLAQVTDILEEFLLDNDDIDIHDSFEHKNDHNEVFSHNNDLLGRFYEVQFAYKATIITKKDILYVVYCREYDYTYNRLKHLCTTLDFDTDKYKICRIDKFDISGKQSLSDKPTSLSLMCSIFKELVLMTAGIPSRLKK